MEPRIGNLLGYGIRAEASQEQMQQARRGLVYNHSSHLQTNLGGVEGLGILARLGFEELG